MNVLADPSAAARDASAWHVWLAELGKLVKLRESAGPLSDDAEPWEPVYEAHLRAGPPSSAQIPEPVGNDAPGQG